MGGPCPATPPSTDRTGEVLIALGKISRQPLRESSAAEWNEPRITRGGRLEEMLVLVVGLVADEQAGMMPGLDGVPLHAEMRRDLVEGEQAGSSKPVPVAQKVMVAA